MHFLHPSRLLSLPLIALCFFVISAPERAHAESGRLNLHLDLGLITPPLGGYGAVAADWRIAGPVAVEVAFGAGFFGATENLFGESIGGSAFAIISAGARFRILDDVSGYPADGGSRHGQLWVAPHAGLGLMPGGPRFVFDISAGYEFNVAEPVSMGLFVRPTFTFDSVDGVNAAFVGGLTVSFEFLHTRAPVDPDRDQDGVLNTSDECPGTMVGTEVDERGCVPIVEVLVLDGITFAFDSAQIQPGAEGVLNHARRMLLDNPEVRVEVGGHTDDIGEPAHNDRLSRQRAESVASWLRAHDVERARLRVRGYGSQVPREANLDEASRSRNRRIEFRVIH